MSYRLSDFFFLRHYTQFVTQHRGSNWSSVSLCITSWVVCVPYFQTAEPMYCIAFDSRAYGKLHECSLTFICKRPAVLAQNTLNWTRKGVLSILAISPSFSWDSKQRREIACFFTIPFSCLLGWGLFCFVGLFAIVNVETFGLGGWRKDDKAVNGNLNSLHARDYWSVCLYSQCD